MFSNYNRKYKKYKVGFIDTVGDNNKPITSFIKPVSGVTSTYGGTMDTDKEEYNPAASRKLLSWAKCFDQKV